MIYDYELPEIVDEAEQRGYNKAIDDAESKFLNEDKIHWNLQEILHTLSELKDGGNNDD